MPAAANTPTGTVVVGVHGDELRRQLGPVAWCALETVVASTDDRDVASVSVRSLAVDLGVSKNTAQRALTTLRAAGLVEPLPPRRDDGRFGPEGYRVVATVLGRVATPGEAPTAVVGAATPRPRARRPRVRPVVVEQLSLLPEV